MYKGNNNLLAFDLNMYIMSLLPRKLFLHEPRMILVTPLFYINRSQRAYMFIDLWYW